MSRPNLRSFADHVLFVALEGLFVFPLLWWAVKVLSTSASSVLTLVVIVLYAFLGVAVLDLLHIRRLALGVVIGLVVTTAFVYVMGPPEWKAGLIGVLDIIAYLRGYVVAARDEREVNPNRYVIAFFVYLLCPFFYHVRPQMVSSVGILFWAGALTLVVSVFVANRSNLRYVTLTQGRPQVSKDILRGNTVYVVLFCAIAFLIAGIRPLSKGVAWLVSIVFSTLARWIGMFLRLLAGKQVKETTKPHAANPFKMAGGHSSRLAHTLDIIAMVVAGVIALGLAVLLFIALIRVVRRYLPVLARWFGLKVSGNEAGDAGYVDETVNLRSERAADASPWANFLSRLRDAFTREPKYSELKTNRERIRHLYRHVLLGALQGGYEAKTSLTPLETARDLAEWKKMDEDLTSLADTYESTRYGNHEPSDERVAELKRELESRHWYKPR